MRKYMIYMLKIILTKNKKKSTQAFVNSKISSEKKIKIKIKNKILQFL